MVSVDALIAQARAVVQRAAQNKQQGGASSSCDFGESDAVHKAISAIIELDPTLQRSLEAYTQAKIKRATLLGVYSELKDALAEPSKHWGSLLRLCDSISGSSGDGEREEEAEAVTTEALQACLKQSLQTGTTHAVLEARVASLVAQGKVVMDEARSHLPSLAKHSTANHEQCAELLRRVRSIPVDAALASELQRRHLLLSAFANSKQLDASWGSSSNKASPPSKQEVDALEKIATSIAAARAQCVADATNAALLSVRLLPRQQRRRPCHSLSQLCRRR
jgi:hypothetical protein